MITAGNTFVAADEVVVLDMPFAMVFPVCEA